MNQTNKGGSATAWIMVAVLAAMVVISMYVAPGLRGSVLTWVLIVALGAIAVGNAVKERH